MAFAGAGVGAAAVLGMILIVSIAMNIGGVAYGKSMFGGYGFAPFRMLFGLVLALLCGFVAGYVLAWTYNRA
ncbi:Uncharacterised protein [uncultured archaeon]|nr:Uncharacterised protein [uncultured archaeon]